jgi:hypothetical protein
MLTAGSYSEPLQPNSHLNNSVDYFNIIFLSVFTKLFKVFLVSLMHDTCPSHPRLLYLTPSKCEVRVDVLKALFM